jgi:hypothetical protein
MYLHQMQQHYIWNLTFKIIFIKPFNNIFVAELNNQLVWKFEKLTYFRQENELSILINCILLANVYFSVFKEFIFISILLIIYIDFKFILSSHQPSHTSFSLLIFVTYFGSLLYYGALSASYSTGIRALGACSWPHSSIHCRC